MPGKRTLELNVAGDASQAVQQTQRLDRATGKLQQQQERAGARLERTGRTLTRTLTPAAAATGAAFAAMSQEADAGLDNIRSKTGAAGERLEGYGDSMRAVKGRVLADMGTIGSALGDLQTLTGAEGDALEELTEHTVKASEAMGEDAAGNAELFGQAMQQWDVPVDRGTELLDGLVGLTQQYGGSLSDLLSNLNEYGPVLKNANLSTEESAELMARLNAEGISFSRISPGLNMAFRRWAEAGKAPREELARVVEQMQEAETSTEALAIASEVFGAEGAQRVVAAARAGALEVGTLGDAMEGTRGKVDDLHADSLNLIDRLQIIKNRAQAAITPFADLGFAISGIALGLGPAITGLGKLHGVMARSQTLKYARGVLATKFAITGLGTAATVAAPGLAVLAVGLFDMWRRSEEARRKIAQLAGELEDSGDPVDFWTEKLNNAIRELPGFGRALQDMGSSTGEMAEALVAGGDEWDTYRQRVLDTGEAGNHAGAILDGMRSRVEAVEGVLSDTGDVSAETGDEMETAAEQTAQLERELDDGAGAARRQADGLKEAEGALREWESALRAQFDPMFAMQDALRSRHQAEQKLNEAIAEHGANSQQASDANLDLASAALDVTAAASQLQQGIDSGTVSVEQSRAQLDAWVQQGLLTQEQADQAKLSFFMLGAEADRLDGRSANVVATATDAATPTLEAVERKVRELDGTKTRIQVLIEEFGFMGMRGMPTYGGTRQHGGPVRPHSLYEVAEDGPEVAAIGGRTWLMTGAEGGTVQPMRGGAQPIIVNVEVQGSVISAERDLLKIVESAARRGVRIAGVTT